MSRRPPLKRQLLFGLLATALCLLAFEGAARALTAMGLSPRPRSESSLAGSPELGWMRRPGFTGTTGDGHERAFDAQGYQSIDSDQITDQQLPRVVFIGDSNTFGYGVPSRSSFVEVADRLLTGASAINLGVPGYSSAQGVVVARTYLPVVKPVIAVISFNFNDRRYTPGLPDGADHFHAVYRAELNPQLERITRLAERSHAFIIVRAVARRVTRTLAGGSRTGQVEDLGRVVPRVSVDDYKRNLEAMVETCLANGVRPVFMLLRDDPAKSRPLRTALAAQEAGDLPSAIRGLEAIVEQRTDEVASTEALARTHLATAYRQSGRMADAVTILQMRKPAPEMDGLSPIRLDTEYNRAMIEVAGRLNVEVFDAASILEEAGGTYIDLSHFNESGHRMVGERLAARLSELVAAVPDPTAGR